MIFRKPRSYSTSGSATALHWLIQSSFVDEDKHHKTSQQGKGWAVFSLMPASHSCCTLEQLGHIGLTALIWKGHFFRNSAMFHTYHDTFGCAWLSWNSCFCCSCFKDFLNFSYKLKKSFYRWNIKKCLFYFLKFFKFFFYYFL